MMKTELHFAERIPSPATSVPQVVWRIGERNVGEERHMSSTVD